MRTKTPIDRIVGMVRYHDGTYRPINEIQIARLATLCGELGVSIPTAGIPWADKSKWQKQARAAGWEFLFAHKSFFAPQIPKEAAHDRQ